MSCFHVIITTCLVAAILIFNGQVVNSDDAIEKNVASIMDDLEYIDQKESSLRSSRGGDDPEIIKVLLENCKALLEKDAKIKPGENYKAVVQKSLRIWNRCAGTWNRYAALAEWDFETDITDHTTKVNNDVQVEVSGYSSKLTVLTRAYLHDDRSITLSEDQYRQLRLLAMDDTSQNADVQRKVAALQSEMEDIYSKATVDDLPMEPDITRIMASSRDGDTLEKYWVEWRSVTGAKMKDLYAEFVENLNIGAKENGYHDHGESWLEEQFDNVGDIKAISEQLWDNVKPLYQQLHAYVRIKLAEHYKGYNDIFQVRAIPAHLTGNMWAQNWNNIYDIVKPFPDVAEPDYDKAMLDNGFTVEGMFKLAEEFYTSIGLYPMTNTFNKLSMKERPEDRKVVCHASASDFFKDDDFRIKMCTEINTEYLDVIHHEMGHIEYFMAYKDQPTVYRTGANSGFHEAIGDTIGLSVMSRKHMAKIGLDVDSTSTSSTTKSTHGLSSDEKREINFLMKMALYKIAFLPFGYMIDKWRWDVFDGTVTKDNYNRHWWDLRLKYQGILPPVPRSEADFDPGAKFHIPSNAPYICYFISFMLQFQFYEAMCDKSGQLANNEPLHTCDFYQSKEAGKLLKDMMSLGESRPWNETLYSMTGSYEISSSSILKYFQPLTDWLTDHNTNSNTPIGWENARVKWKGESQSKTRKNAKVDAEDEYTDIISRLLDLLKS